MMTAMPPPPAAKPYPAAFVDAAPAASRPREGSAIEKVQYQEPAALPAAPAPAAPAAPALSAVPAPPALPAAPVPPAAPPVKEPTPEGIVREYVVPPPSSEKPAEKPFVCSTIPDKPYTTTGVVFFGGSPPPRGTSEEAPQAVKARQPLEVPAQQLQQNVQALCGSTIQSVQVRMQPDGTYKVDLQAADKARAQAASQLLSRMPELNAPNVQVHISVGP
jgi:hypothetical protein